MNGFRKNVSDGLVISGIDHGGVGKILSENNEYVAVKWPAHTYWSGIGVPRSYALPEVEIFLKSKMNDEEYLTSVLSWSTGRINK